MNKKSTTTEVGDAFEELVFKIFQQTNPAEIEFFKGGGDRGRDIVLKYNIDNQIKKVIVECKFRSDKVNLSDISSSVDWAKVHRPDLYYIWTNSYILPNVKDFLSQVSINYDLQIAYEEKDNVEYFSEAVDTKNIKILKSLTKKIYKKLKESKELTSLYLQYNDCILLSDHELVNRINEKTELLNQQYNIFIICGPSCVGKTQLLKVIAKEFNNAKKNIFWFKFTCGQDDELQLKSFLESMAIFFGKVCKDQSLLHYLKTHGFNPTNNLLLLLEILIKKYKPIFFIDDIHYCQSDKCLILFSNFITNKECRAYFIGWYNPLPADYLNNANLCMVDIEPLNNDCIRLIAKKVQPDISAECLEDVVKRSEGLPGLAEIIPLNYEYSEELEDYFRTIIEKMNRYEQAIVYSLAISSIAIPLKLIKKKEYETAARHLVRKRLIKQEGYKILLHDKYKEKIKNLIDESIIETYEILNACAAVEPIIYIDLLNFYCKIKNEMNYFELLDKAFYIMTDNGLDYMLLRNIQKAEAEKTFEKHRLHLIIKKMILLERKSDYDLLGMYINITSECINIEHKDYFQLKYLNLRYDYFCNDYLKIVDSFFKDLSSYKEYPKKLYYQILFIIGRIFYVVGNMETALEIYYYIFNDSIKNFRAISIKALHRICIIEEKLGLYDEVIKSLEALIEPQNTISAKRLSYAYYRIGKCYLGKKNLNQAHENNNKSIEIKESLNSQRGIVFSEKLNSQIYLHEQNDTMALYSAKKAYAGAKKISTDKEIATTGLTLAKILLEQDSSENYNEAKNLLSESLLICEKLCLSFRINQIIQLSMKYTISEIELQASEKLDKVKKLVDRMQNLYNDNLQEEILQKVDKISVYKLFNDRKSLSQKLLLII